MKKRATLHEFRWVRIKGNGTTGDDVDRWGLMVNGRKAATVFDNGVWHTWDKSGTGMENDRARSVASAKWIAYCSVLGQGEHGYGPLINEEV